MCNFITENKEIISLFASIGTFISSIIAIYTLLEVKKQRLSTYKPQILLKSFLVYINKSPLCLEPEELQLFKTENFNEYKDNTSIKKEYEVSSLYKIENLGFGIAKNIKVTWNFDMQKALKLLEKELSQEFHLNQYKPLNYYFIHKKNNEKFQITLKNEKEIIQTTDYITPINIKEHAHYHSIPKDVTIIHFLYFIFKNKLTNTVNINNSYDSEFENFPVIKLKIEYFDLNDKKYISKYKFKTSIVSTQINDETDMRKEFGYLLFEPE